MIQKINPNLKDNQLAGGLEVDSCICIAPIWLVHHLHLRIHVINACGKVRDWRMYANDIDAMQLKSHWSTRNLETG